MQKRQEDLKLGLSSEVNNFEIFKSFLNDPELKRTKPFDIFDYESDKNLIELKTRRCKSDTYADTMIPMNKINFCKTTNKTVYFFFQFIDGLFYWKYNDFEKLRIGNGGRCDRGINEFKTYCYIPVQLLEKI